MKTRKRRPWKQNVTTKFDLLRDLLEEVRWIILDFLGDKKRWDEHIFRHLAYYGIKDRKVVEYALGRLLCDDVIKESREGDSRYFERIRRRHRLLF